MGTETTTGSTVAMKTSDRVVATVKILGLDKKVAEESFGS